MEEFMKIAINEAKKGVKCGEGGPFGAVIVQEDTVIAKAHNTVLKTNDPTAHAEINAIRLATHRLKSFDLSQCVLLTSSEPCPMCLSAIMWAGIKTVYYGCTVDDASRIGFADQFIYKYLKGQCNNETILTLTPLLREQALDAFEIWEKKEDKIPY